MRGKLIAIALLAGVEILTATVGLAEAALAIAMGWKLAWRIAGVCGTMYLLCKLWEKVIRSSF